MDKIKNITLFSFIISVALLIKPAFSEVDLNANKRLSFTNLSSFDARTTPEVSYEYSYRVDNEKLRYPLSEFWEGCTEDHMCEPNYIYYFRGNALPNQVDYNANLVPIVIGDNNNFDASNTEFFRREYLDLSSILASNSDSFIQVGVKELYTISYEYDELGQIFPDVGTTGEKFFGELDFRFYLNNSNEKYSNDFRLIIRSYVEQNGISSKCGLSSVPFKINEIASGICNELPYVNSEISLYDILDLTGSLPEEFVTKYDNAGDLDGFFSKESIDETYLSEPAKIVIQIEIQYSVVNLGNVPGFNFVELNQPDTEKESGEQSNSSSGGAMALFYLLFIGLILVFLRKKGVIKR